MSPPAAASLQSLLSRAAASCSCLCSIPHVKPHVALACSPVGCGGCCQPLDIRSRACVNICALAFVRMNIFLSLKSVPGRRVAAPHGTCVVNFTGNGPSVVQGGRTVSIAHQQSTGCWLLPTLGHMWHFQAVLVSLWFDAAFPDC